MPKSERDCLSDATLRQLGEEELLKQGFIPVSHRRLIEEAWWEDWSN